MEYDGDVNDGFEIGANERNAKLDPYGGDRFEWIDQGNNFGEICNEDGSCCMEWDYTVHYDYRIWINSAANNWRW